MNSTDDARAALEDFFRERLVPAAEALRARDARFFATGAETDAVTYWRARGEASDYLDTVEPGEIAARLREMWAPHPELLALVGPLLELSAALGRAAGEQPAEVSPLIYAMY